MIALIAGLALIGGAAFLFVRHRRKAARKQQLELPADEKKGRPRSYSEVDAGTAATRLELGGNEVGRVEKDGFEVR